MTAPDLRSLHRDALTVADSFVSRVTPADLHRPTPCAGWDLAALLAHMVGQHRGFAAAARDGNAGKTAYRPEEFTPAGWRGSVDDLTAAFAGMDPDMPVLLVELHPLQPLPTEVVVGAHLLDTAVHTWDVARSLGLSFSPDPETAAEVLRVAEPLPDDESRDRPGAAFAHAVPTDATDPWERSLALLGRNPVWRPAPQDVELSPRS